VRYETLTTRPIAALAAIYDHVNEPLFAHDPMNIEPAYDMIEFDMRLGTPGLHHVGSAVRAEKRPTILPPDLFRRFEQDAFWDDLSAIPKAVKVI